MLFDAVPLLILAALYLAVGLAVAPALWRERGHAHGIGFATALVFPCVGLAAAVVGVETLVTREAPTGNALIALLGILLAALPLVVIARNWRDLGLLVTATRGAQEPNSRRRAGTASSQSSAASRTSCSMPRARTELGASSWTS